MTSLEKVQENAAGILVGVRTPEQNPDDCMENMKELEQLAITAGVNVKYILKQDRQRIHPSQSIGSGKIIELKEHIDRTGSNLVIFDENLSPAQIKNLESLLNIKIVDRSTIILDIFAKHAKTRESKTQVELAQLQYLLPRLTRQWTHLSRQAGHIGIKGPGETQLETDRRLVRKRIIKLQSDLHDIEKQRAVRRSNRKNYFQVSLVGYTNVGKSTIMNMLSGANLLVENQLFATLDSTIRRVKLNENHQILLSDTVGFIRKLPPHLVASFKSTLEEIRNSDLILHIVDASYPKFEDQMEVVGGILGDLDATKIPVLLIFNKIDLLENLEQLSVLKKKYKESIFISAIRGIGFDSLKEKIIEFREKNFISTSVIIPAKEQKFIHFLHSTTLVEKEDYIDHCVKVTFKCGEQVYQQLMDKYRKIPQINVEENKQKDRVK